jgi:hypothetical protein
MLTEKQKQSKRDSWKKYYEKNKEIILKKNKEYAKTKPDIRNAINKRYRKSHPEWSKNNDIKKLYGITVTEMNIIRDNQNNKCKICNKTFIKTPHIDHNHKTGKVRGLLCGKCNSILGYCNDDISILQNAIAYLGEYKS